MRNQFDVVIAGGGVVGSACAYFLHTHPRFRGTVAVVEPDPTYRDAASARSASSIRQQFSTPINIALSGFGMDFLRDAPQRLANSGERAELGLVDSSYLYLATPVGRAALERCVAIQRQCSVSVQLHDRHALSTRYPWLNTADLSAGSDTSHGEGWFDGYALLSSLRRVNQSGGVNYLRDKVVGFERNSDGSVGAVVLESGRHIACNHIVNAAGTRSRQLAAEVGVELPVFARKRHVFVFTSPATIPRCPLVIDPSGLWFRPERDRFICGVPAEPDPDVPPDDFDIDTRLFEDVAWPLLAQRVPAFEAVRMTGAWTGHYDYNTFDQNAFIGAPPGVPNFLLASGFSGHGLQQAPAIGRGLAEYIVLGRYESLDLTPLSYERYVSHSPLRELNVI